MKNIKPAFHVIRRLEVTGGFLHGLTLDFGDHLNCIIGARGTGKTTVLEFIRWALDNLPPEAAGFARTLERLVQTNLGTGQITLVIETMRGVRYTIQKGSGKEGRVLDERGNPVHIEIGKGNIFSADIYSQNQIEEIANDPLFQLKLIDKFVAQEIRELNGKIQTLVTDLRTNANDLLKLTDEISRLKEQMTELTEVTEKLKAYKIDETTAEKKALQQESRLNALRDQERRAIRSIQDALTGVADHFKAGLRTLHDEVVEVISEELLAGPNADSMRQVQGSVEMALRLLTKKVDEVVRSTEAAQGELQRKAEELRAAHDRQEQAYQKLLQRSEKEKERMAERDQLLRRLGELQESQKKMDKRREELLKKETARQQMLRQMSDLRDQRFRLRADVARSLSEQLDPTIRVRINPYGNTDAYRDMLVEHMKGSGFRYTPVVERLVQRISPPEFAAIVRRADVQALQEHLEIEADRANRIILQLRDSRAIFEIEVVELHDRPSIELKDGEDYKDSSNLSTGQKCTTILPILLLESASPLLIDQPEDNLDNAFIYETVVKSVRGVRGKRQLIFVTHNPNIPVLGEAERVMVLQSTGRQARLKAVGTVDELKEEVEIILEGGKEAFCRRKQHYGY